MTPRALRAPVARSSSIPTVVGLVAWAATLVVLPAPLPARVMLVAPLVVIPRLLSLLPRRPWLGRFGPWTALAAAAPLPAACSLVPGPVAGALAIPWLALSVVAVFAAGADALARLRQGGSLRAVPELGVDAALGFWTVGAAAMAWERLGLPAPFPPVIVLLTATHFHLAGAGLVAIAALLAMTRPLVAAAVIGLVAGIPVTALGFVLPSAAVGALGAALVGSSGIGVALALLTAGGPPVARLARRAAGPRCSSGCRWASAGPSRACSVSASSTSIRWSARTASSTPSPWSRPWRRGRAIGRRVAVRAQESDDPNGGQPRGALRAPRARRQRFDEGLQAGALRGLGALEYPSTGESPCSLGQIADRGDSCSVDPESAAAAAPRALPSPAGSGVSQWVRLPRAPAGSRSVAPRHGHRERSPDVVDPAPPQHVIDEREAHPLHARRPPHDRRLVNQRRVRTRSSHRCHDDRGLRAGRELDGVERHDVARLGGAVRRVPEQPQTGRRSACGHAEERDRQGPVVPERDDVGVGASRANAVHVVRAAPSRLETGRIDVLGTVRPDLGDIGTRPKDRALAHRVVRGDERGDQGHERQTANEAERLSAGHSPPRLRSP